MNDEQFGEYRIGSNRGKNNNNTALDRPYTSPG